MGLRILSGVIAPSNRTKGTATIIFRSHSLTGDVQNAGPDQNRVTNGAAGNYLAAPCFTVSIREFMVSENPDLRNRRVSNRIDEMPERDYFTVWTSVKDDHLLVGWETADHDVQANGGTSLSEIIELSYMIIGET